MQSIVVPSSGGSSSAEQQRIQQLTEETEQLKKQLQLMRNIASNALLEQSKQSAAPCSTKAALGAQTRQASAEAGDGERGTVLRMCDAVGVGGWRWLRRFFRLRSLRVVPSTTM